MNLPVDLQHPLLAQPASCRARQCAPSIGRLRSKGKTLGRNNLRVNLWLRVEPPGLCPRDTCRWGICRLASCPLAPVDKPAVHEVGPPQQLLPRGQKRQYQQSGISTSGSHAVTREEGKRLTINLTAATAQLSVTQSYDRMFSFLANVAQMVRRRGVSTHRWDSIDDICRKAGISQARGPDSNSARRKFAGAGQMQ
jgi:hypothetical protein